jgi:Carboxypeptidase regulatory-like domain
LKSFRALHLLLLIICLTIPASPQSTNATLSGVVVDLSGKVITDADIEILNEATGVHYSGKTNGTGIYTVSILPPGQYLVQASKRGFKTLIKPGITLNVQSAVVLNFTLPIGATSESVTVEAGTSLLNTTDASVSTVVDRQFVENMPLNGRSLQSLISLAPGVVQTPIPYGSSSGQSGEFSINGQRTESNSYSVDGVSGNFGVGSNGTYSAGPAGLVPNQTALGTTQTLANIDALQEFRISTSTYSAEYGRTPGGQISLQTRSGTDEVHGNLFNYFRNNALDANNWFNDHTSPVTPKTAERQNDFGGTFGGPILLPRIYDGRHRTFFFYSYEGLRLTVPTPSVITEVPDLTLRETTPSALLPVIDSFPLPNGTPVAGADNLAYLSAAYSLPSGLNSNSLRIDHALGNSTSIFGRYSDTTSSSTTRSSSDLAQLLPLNSITRSLTSGLTRTFSNRLANDARFNYSSSVLDEDDRIDSLGGAESASLNTFVPMAAHYSQFAAFLFTGDDPGIDLTVSHIGQTQINLVDTQQLSLGRHLIKVGADYRRLVTTQIANQFEGTLLYFSSAQVIANSAALAIAQTNGLRAAEPIYTNFSAFIQDEWKLKPRISLSLGLRWDLNPPPTNGNGPTPPVLNQITNLATAQIAPAQTPEWNTDYAGFAPRIGFSSQLNTRPGHETVLRTGIGNFLDTGNTLSAIGFTGLGFGSTQSYAGLSFPLAPTVYNLPAPSTSAPYNQVVVGYARNLRLPYALEWNLSLEQALGTSSSFTLGYVASAGRRLTVGLFQNPEAINPAYSEGNGADIIENGSWSNYQSLQAKFQQRLSHGLQILAAMTWSHSIDNLSTSFINYEPLLKGDSDFDVRDNFQAALTYDVPVIHSDHLLRPIINNWSIDLRSFVRTAAPVDIFGSTYIASNGTEQYARPNLIPGVPLYVYGPRDQIPGGREINFDAFQTVTGSLGNAPRNFVRGFGENETDLAIRRQLSLSEHLKMQFRAEAFNLLNRPDFGAIYNTMNTGASLFGQAENTLNVSLKNQSALYEQGGPRSLQLALKLLF